MITYELAVKMLIAERRRRKLRQSDVEEMSGLGKGYISILERGSKVATVPTFLRWCWALEVNPFAEAPRAPYACRVNGGQAECKPTYYCPTAGEYESPCHGGFDTCCRRPELHRDKP